MFGLRILEFTRRFGLYCSSCRQLSTHYTIVPRSSDSRWKDVDMTREGDDFDVVIVGGGAAGLSTAIKLRQLALENEKELRVCLLEKGAYIGAHSLSGACFDPSGMDALFPGWRENLNPPPLQTRITDEKIWYLTEKRKLKLPILPSSNVDNRGNYLIRYGHFNSWLGEKAEELGVEIYPGYGAAEILFDSDSVVGVATNDMGIGLMGNPKDTFERGMELRAKVTVFAEGCHGHLTKQLIKKYCLRDESIHQTYGVGVKEIWEVDQSKHNPGMVEHLVGWPLDSGTYGGYFVYHYGNEGSDSNLVGVGMIVALDYKNTYLSPFKELQRLKLHPHVSSLLDGANRISYGARAINEGGFQTLPRLAFPGGMLVGCSAGFLDVARAKGIHNAMKSGITAAQVIFDNVGDLADRHKISEEYVQAIKESQVMKDLYKGRNYRPSFKWGRTMGILHTGTIYYLFGGKEPWTLKHCPTPDHASLERNCRRIDYPQPDGKLTFDLMSSVSLTNTNHPADQPPHLTVADEKGMLETNLGMYDGPEERFCPAGVYEYVEGENGPRLQINFQNCIHCKTCDIKDPSQSINWVTPEGGGPAYDGM